MNIEQMTEELERIAQAKVMHPDATAAARHAAYILRTVRAELGIDWKESTIEFQRIVNNLRNPAAGGIPQGGGGAPQDGGGMEQPASFRWVAPPVSSQATIKFDVNVSTTGDGCIHTLTTLGAQILSREIAQTKDEKVRQALIGMGWTPPPATHRHGDPKIAPWPDHSGRLIHEGDIIRHPAGMEGVVVYDPSRGTDYSRWRVRYPDMLSTLALFQQIDGKGQGSVVVKKAPGTDPGQTQQTL